MDIYKEPNYKIRFWPDCVNIYIFNYDFRLFFRRENGDKGNCTIFSSFFYEIDIMFFFLISYGYSWELFILNINTIYF